MSPVPKHINTKYSAIIFEDTDNLIKARVSTTGSNVTIAAVDVEWDTTTKLIGTTATKFVTTAKTERKIVSIFNSSETFTLYIGTSNTVTAGINDGSTTDGWEIGPRETYNVASGPNVDWYGICLSGQSALVKFGEGK